MAKYCRSKWSPKKAPELTSLSFHPSSLFPVALGFWNVPCSAVALPAAGGGVCPRLALYRPSLLEGPLGALTLELGAACPCPGPGACACLEGRGGCSSTGPPLDGFPTRFIGENAPGVTQGSEAFPTKSQLSELNVTVKFAAKHISTCCCGGFVC